LHRDLSPAEFGIVPVPWLSPLRTFPRLGLEAVAPTIHGLLLPHEEVVSPLVLLKGFGGEAVAVGGVVVVHDGLEPGDLSPLATVASVGVLGFAGAFARVGVASTLAIPETCGSLHESSHAAILGTNVSQDGFGTHAHTRVEEETAGLLRVGVSKLVLELGHVAHVPWDHVRLRREGRTIVGETGTLHDDDGDVGNLLLMTKLGNSTGPDWICVIL